MADRRVDLEHMLVHNLKSPVTGILATLEMLADGDFGALTQAQHAAVRDIQGHGAELLGLLDEILDLWRLESAEPSVQLVAVDPGKFLQRVRRDWGSRFGHRLTTHAAAGTPVVLADEVMLLRVIGNLLLNTLTYAGADARVRIEAARAGAGVRITVSDDGPGVPAADAERVFEKFVRLDRDRDPSRSGSGLGLAYCRAAMTAMGGRILLEPDARGASFRIELPAHPAGRAP